MFKVKKENNRNKTGRLEKLYKHICAEDFVYKSLCKNTFLIPHLNKMVLNTTGKEFIRDTKEMVPPLLGWQIVTNQKLKPTKARKSIATFKVREKDVIGCTVTLRKTLSFVFLDKVVNLLLPGNREFDLLDSQLLSQNGNLTLGFNGGASLIFPELHQSFSLFERVGGFDLSFVFDSKIQTMKQSVVSQLNNPFKDSFRLYPLEGKRGFKEKGRAGKEGFVNNLEKGKAEETRLQSQALCSALGLPFSKK